MYVIMYVDGFYPDSLTDSVLYPTIEAAVDKFEHYNLNQFHKLGDTLVDDDNNALVGNLPEYPDYRVHKLISYNN